MKQSQIPVKMLTTLTILMVFLCVGSYLLSPKWQAVRAQYQRQRDPLHQFASQQTPEAQLQVLQDKIRANPQNSEQWALLGEYYLWQNDYSNSLLAYRQALQLRGENAELYAALATVLYYQASQHMTAQTRAMIDKALALDSNLMLLASDAFMQANYAQAIELWQKVMDLNSPRINRTQLVESINMAKLLQRRSD
ncbi:heme lyase NrfEFG subunit NrfG [Escherichia coli]|uniref:heme lyase NrfEFG subunit NrfG n=1 Tax=Escherichia coli TaxID=562 RepID=UPI0021C753EE|nr:heme lyase NrfEFG subunit NrfG [Escherichia coli]MCU0000882.1 heme lyase NrfEFG subunit NrfG [Escherichia coli]